MKIKIILLILVAFFSGFLYLKYHSKDNSTELKYYIFYKSVGGKIGKTAIPAPSSTPDGNIYMTGANDPVVYGVSVGLSGEIILKSDPLDTATSFSQIIPPDNWQLFSTGAPWTTRLYKVFQLIENGNTKKTENLTDEEEFIYDLYGLFSDPKTSPLRECAENLNEDVIVGDNAGKSSKEICSKKVPEDLTFDMFRTDLRFLRMRIGLTYKAYTEKNSEVCKSFLRTKFSDVYDDSLEALMYNYLLCGTLARGDAYSRDIPLSEALRRLFYRFGVAISRNSCSLYEEPEIQSMCVKIYNYRLQTRQRSESPSK